MPFNYETMSNTSTTPSVGGGVVFKITLDRGGAKEPELRRVRGSFNFEEMISIVRHMWNSAPKRVTVEYVDEEGDRVRVGSELEWAEAVQQHAQRGQPSLKLFVRRGRQQRKKAGGVVEDDSSDSEADVTSVAMLPREVTVPVAAASVPVPAALPTVNVPTVVVPPLMVERAVSHVDTDVDEVTYGEEQEFVEEPQKVEDPPQFTEPASENDFTIELLGRLYDCDAAKEMLDMFSRVDFTPVVTRRVDAVAQEVHVDVDKVALRHLTVTRTNLWIGSGLYEKAEATLEAALHVWPSDSVLEYNIACAASLRGETAKAVSFLRACVTHGYSNVNQMKRDPDLAHARDHPDFGAVIDLARGASTTPAAAPRRTETIVAAPPAPKEETDVDRLLAVFPHLTTHEAAALLRRFQSLALAVNHCLQHA